MKCHLPGNYLGIEFVPIIASPQLSHCYNAFGELFNRLCSSLIRTRGLSHQVPECGRRNLRGRANLGARQFIFLNELLEFHETPWVVFNDRDFVEKEQECTLWLTIKCCSLYTVDIWK